MVLLDTNVWIEFLKNNTDYFDRVSILLKNQMVVTIEPIFAELFYGVRNSKDKMIIEQYWRILPKVKVGDQYLIQASKYANENKYYSLGIGLIDAIILKAVRDNSLLIWTLDKKILNNLEITSIYKYS